MSINLLKSSLFIWIFFLPFAALSQEQELEGWHHLDPSEGAAGVGTAKAYELLKDRKPKKVVVAILDSGVDTDHEDLQDNIWINEDEIAGNGLDDDNNGYVDDVHGWNFLGNAEGANLDKANLEMTRIYRKLAPRFQELESASDVAKEDKADYALFVEVQTKILEELNKSAQEFAQIDAFSTIFRKADSTANIQFGDAYTIENILSWEPETEDLQFYQNVLAGVLQDPSFSPEKLEQYHDYLLDQLEYHYNPNFVDRASIGDDYENVSERFYGNNDVSAPHDDHGTHVAGIVGAVVNNGHGMDGICRNVELMILRTVPNGDEFDKDVANAISYAADNGAQIMNMSFGKGYSPQSLAVYEAIKYAEDKGVLMIHAAGNDGQNIDKEPNFPNPNYPFQKQECSTWLTVGASSSKADEYLVGAFSNYGKKKVDIMAPGVRIYSTKPDNTYEFEDGTSMAAPVVTGVAALLKSYFPELSAQQVKKILLDSSNKYPKLKIALPNSENGYGKTSKLSKITRNGGVVSAVNAVNLAISRQTK